PDVVPAVARLAEIAPLGALTNSDTMHRAAVEAQLGRALSYWIPAEEVRCYKPALRFWEAARGRLGRRFGSDWWHVSAYADYDLDVAHRLGLTTVFVERMHRRPGPADHHV